MTENQMKCTGNCMDCTVYQRQFCASKLAYNNMRMIGEMSKIITSMNESITALSDKVEAMQNNEGTLFEPTLSQDPRKKSDLDTAQKG